MPRRKKRATNDAQVWREDAACKKVDPEVFFPEPIYSTKNSARRKPSKRIEQLEARAKRICARCTVRVECLDYAITFREREGVWGGMNQQERRVEIRRRSRRS